MTHMLVSAHKHSVIFVLLVTMLTSTVGWAFSAAATTQVFEHELRVHSTAWIVQEESGHGHAACCDDGAGEAAHLSLHAAEHSQVFSLGRQISVIALFAVTRIASVVSIAKSELVLSSLYRPPRTHSSI